ncbi:helix-turn-helix transcriptional regulator [Rapidithrix thailandica]|uniref:Helix-turn-helix transcriptional regulator n=1 Tax=Rapidithrix thailandica TaxID=413964 RepID=A0AAW9S152_9BACT
MFKDKPLDVPKFSTTEFKTHFFEQNQAVHKVFKNNYEDFLIAKFEDFRESMNLPIPFYRRPVTEILFITQGSIHRGCNLNKIPVKENQTHLWLENHIATVEAFSEDISGFYCHFTYNFLSDSYHTTRIIRDLQLINKFTHHRPLTPKNTALKAMQNIYERLYEIFHSDNNPQLIRTYLQTLLLEIKKSLPSSKESPKLSRPVQLTEQFKELLFAHVTKEQSLKFYAEKLFVSSNHLNKSVKQSTGKTASEWLFDALTLEAKVLLKQSDLPIGNVAFRLGFEDQSYFCKFFKKQTGVLPSRFRQMD